MNDTKIYLHSLEYAQSNNELEAYWGSAKVSRECAAAIDKAISASNYEQYHYNLSDALGAVTKDFSLNRVAYVIAGAIKAYDDGRYSRANKNWASDVDISREEARRFVFQSHATILDGFADKVREAQLESVMQPPEHLAGLSDISMTFAADYDQFMEDCYPFEYWNTIEEVGGKENGIREIAQSVLYHKTDWLKEELQGMVDVNDNLSDRAQGLLNRLEDLEKQIVDIRPVVLPVSYDTFPDCDLSGAEYVLANGEMLRHCTYEPDYFMSESRLADGTLNTPRIYEAMWDAEGLPESFRRTDEVEIISQPITARMDAQAFQTAVEKLLPDSTPKATDIWIQFAQERVDKEQYVAFKEEPETTAKERWLNNLYSGLKAVKEDFGEAIAVQVCELSTIQSCLYPGEMCPAAQHLQDGRTPYEIRDMVTNCEGLDCSELAFPTRKDLFKPDDLYRIKIENPYEPVGTEIAIRQEGVPYGLIERQTEPGYILKDGTALLECERDAYGNYQGGAGMDGMYLKTGKLYAPVVGYDGQIQSFYKLHNKMLRECDKNPLEAAEMSAEQNYNQIDGVINNEPPRCNQGYVILQSEVVGHIEMVLAEDPAAPSPFVTWQRNMNNDAERGEENFFWGHYFSDEQSARQDFQQRVAEEREDYLDAHPSIRFQLKENAAQIKKHMPDQAPRVENTNER